MATVRKEMLGSRHRVRVYRNRRGKGVGSRINIITDKNARKINFSELFEPNEKEQNEEDVQEAFNRAYAETLDDWEGDIE